MAYEVDLKASGNNQVTLIKFLPCAINLQLMKIEIWHCEERSKVRMDGGSIKTLSLPIELVEHKWKYRNHLKYAVKFLVG